MAHVRLYRSGKNNKPRIKINGVDFTDELFADGLRITSTGSGEHDEMCVELKLALSRLDIGDHLNVDAALLVGSALTQMARPVPTLLEKAEQTLERLRGQVGKMGGES